MKFANFHWWIKKAPLSTMLQDSTPVDAAARLATLEEAVALMGGRPLYPGEDQWCAVQGLPQTAPQANSSHEQPNRPQENAWHSSVCVAQVTRV